MATALTPTNTAVASDVLEASTTWVITLGFTAKAGRLLTLLVACRSTDPSSQVATPSGWTSVVNRLESGGVSPRLQLFHRSAAGGETSVTLTKSTAIGFFAAIVDEYPVTLASSPADQVASTDGAGATVTTRTATTATSAENVISIAAIAIREGSASSALAVSGESWYQRAAYRMVAGGSDMLLCTAAAEATTAETFTGTWTWTTANRAVVGTYTIKRDPVAIVGNYLNLAEQSMESGVGGWVTNYGFDALTTASVAKDGATSLLYNTSGGTGYSHLEPMVNILPSTSYTFSAYFNNVDFDPGTSRGLILTIFWYQADNTYISETSAYPALTPGGWLWRSVTGTSPSNAAKAYLYIGATDGPANQTFYMDRVCLRTSSSEPPAPPAPLSRFKVWSGSAFVAKPVKVWSGSAWVTKPAKIWNGSGWV